MVFIVIRHLTGGGSGYYVVDYRGRYHMPYHIGKDTKGEKIFYKRGLRYLRTTNSTNRFRDPE